MGSRALLSCAVILVAVGAGACSSSSTGGDSDPRVSRSQKITDRWTPPASSATGTYEGLNGEGCVGGLKSGTKQLGEQIKQQFSITYGGYSCRANTADTSQLSVHATGRALDLMATGDTGEQIANHLVTNASALGVQLIIWNHTLWKVTPTGATSRAYTGPNPHTDHVHAEVTAAVAASGPASVDPSGGSTTPTTPTDPTAPQNPNPPDPTAPTNPGGNPPVPNDPADPGGTGPAIPFPGEEEEEMECRNDFDCDPSGAIFCDRGYCF